MKESYMTKYIQMKIPKKNIDNLLVKQNKMYIDR